MLVFFTHGQFSTIVVFSSIASLVVLFICVFIGIKQTRNKEYEGYIILKYSMKAGIKITLISGLIIGLFTYTYLQYIDTDYFDNYVSKIISNAVNSGVELKSITAMVR